MRNIFAAAVIATAQSPLFPTPSKPNDVFIATPSYNLARLSAGKKGMCLHVEDVNKGIYRWRKCK